MKINVLRAEERGHFDHGWLDTYHSFSFAGYQDPDRMQFGTLRVLNDDIVQPGEGFGTHGHRDMEIVSIPLEGEMAHRDSGNNEAVLSPGRIQVMSAGKGIMHSEYNNSETEELNFLQVWILPEEKNLPPRHEEKSFDPDGRKNKLQFIITPEKDDDSLWLNQTAYFALTELDKETELEYKLHETGHGVFVFVIEGKISLNGETLNKRDSAEISEIDTFSIRAGEEAYLLFIEVEVQGSK